MDTTSNRSKKKKQKNRTKNVLRGPKTQPMIVLTGEDGEELKKILKDLGSLPRSSDLQVEEVEKVKKKKSEEGEKSSSSSSKNILKKDLVFGINEIMRCLRRSECNISGLVVTNPLSTHLQLTLHEVSLQRKVPCLFLDNLHDMSHSLHLSSLTAFALKNPCQETGSICHTLYAVFKKIYEEKTRGLNQEKEEVHGSQQEKLLTVEGDKNNEKDSKDSKETLMREVDIKKTVIRPTNEQLYINKTRRTFLPELILESLTCKKDENEDCISLVRNDVYFPNRHSDKVLTVTQITTMECDDPPLSHVVDQSFTRNLIGDTPESDLSVNMKGQVDKKITYLGAEVVQIQTDRKGEKGRRSKKSRI